MCEKLAFTRTFRFRYQLSPADQACADEAEAVELAKVGNADLSTFSSSYRPTTCQAPQPPECKLKGWRGVTPLYEASSPVNTQLAETSQAVFCKSARAAPFLTSWSETTYSPMIPSGP